MAAKPTRLTRKIAIKLHLVAESCTICSSRSSSLVSPGLAEQMKHRHCYDEIMKNYTTSISTLLPIVIIFSTSPYKISYNSTSHCHHVLYFSFNFSNKIFLEKLTVAQLVKEFPCLYGIRRSIAVFTRVHHWSLS
jgi:hypothetical protein